MYFFLTFYFYNCRIYWKDCRNSSKSSHVPFTWVPQILTFILLALLFLFFFFPEPFGGSFRCDAFYPSRLQYVFSKKYILIHNHCTVIKMSKRTLIQYYYLIYRLYPYFTNHIIIVLYSKRGENGFSSSFRLQCPFCHTLSMTTLCF